MKGTQKLLIIVAILVLGFGVLPLLAQPLPYVGTDWLDYEAVVYYGDKYEPDNTFESANQYSIGLPYQLHNFHITGDQDWIWFMADAGTLYTIHTQANPLGSMADTLVNVYDSSGTTLARDNDGGVGSDSLIYFRPHYAGNYYVQVSEVSHGSGNAYWYRLSVLEFDRYYVPIVLKSQ